MVLLRSSYFIQKIYRNSVQRELFIIEVCVLCSIIPTETIKKYNLIFFSSVLLIYKFYPASFGKISFFQESAWSALQIWIKLHFLELATTSTDLS